LNSYKETITALQRQNLQKINLGLERVKALLELFDNPQKRLNIIHVAGTNGKGSVCAMLSSVLTDAGYKTGLYTSPHLIEYTERIKINGNDISQDEFADLVNQVLQAALKNNIDVTEFEVLTVAAFIYFAQKKTDIALIETGLGGRLDATNVSDAPIVSVITSIDIDHTDRLGNTLEEIAGEKAGIIKQNVPVIVSPENKGFQIIKKTSENLKSPLIICKPEEFDLDKYDLSLKGLWQRENLFLALKTVETLNCKGFKISQSHINQGLKKASHPCRFQYFEKAQILIDGAHNLSGAKALRESLNFYFPTKERIWIYSSLETKDYSNVMKTLFSENDIVIFTKSSFPTAVLPEALEKQALFLFPELKTHVKQNVKDSLSFASDLKNLENLVVIAGSLYSAGEVLKEL
jgi:dihydrofolate synthase / folylpolyglutamate synthase